MNRVTRKKCHVKKKQVVRRGDEGDEGLEKWKGGRRRDCNLINPRLEVVRRSGQLVRARSLQTLGLHPRSAGKKGGARSPRLSFIDPPRLRSMRPYSQRLASDEFHARSRTRAAFSLSPAFINRDRTASRQALKYARRGAGGGDCLERGGRARGRVTPGPGVITMRTRMLELFDEFQTRCVALMEGNVTLYRTVFHLLDVG